MKKVLITFLFCASPAFAVNNIVLSLGESKAVPLGKATSVWIENKQIVTAQAAGGKLILKANKIGESLLRLQGQNQKVQVIHPAQMASYEQLQQEVRKIVGLQVDFWKGQLVLTGHLYRLRDWKKIASRGLHFQMKAEISPEIQEEAQNYFMQLMKQEHLPRQNIIFSNITEVRINPKSFFKEKYEDLFSPYGILTNLDPDTLETAPTVKVQITVAEIKRDFSSSIGVNWPGTYHATLMRGGFKAWSEIEMDINALEKNGHGKILASPNIICRSGKEAEFLAGGEFPIKIINYKIEDIVWKKYGIFLKVKPLADASGRMSISIETEVSTLDAATSVDGIPGILTNHVSSYFDLLKPQTIALSGLIKNEESRSRSGLPFLSRIPILGNLFSSLDFQQNRSELVIFVRPTILEDEQDPDFSHAPKNHLGDVSWD